MNNETNKIFEKVKEICEGYEYQDAPVLIGSIDDTLYGDLGLDSLAVVEIAMLCEGEFNILIDDETICKMRTVKDLVNIIYVHTFENYE